MSEVALSESIVPSEIVQEVVDSAELITELSPELKAPDKDETRQASRFAALARKEKQIQERERAAKEQLLLVEKYKQLEDLKKANPAKWLKEHNLTFEQITQAILNDNDEGEKEPTWQDEISELKRLLKEKDETALKKQQEEEQRYINEQIEVYKRSIKDLVDSEPDTYELIAANEAHDLVYEVMEQYYLETMVVDQKTGLIKKPGIVLPVDQVANHVEEELFARSQKLLGLKKLKPKASEPEAKAVKESTPAQAIRESNAPSTMTLTNAKVTGAVPVEQATRRLTNEEALKKAAELVRWTN